MYILSYTAIMRWSLALSCFTTWFNYGSAWTIGGTDSYGSLFYAPIRQRIEETGAKKPKRFFVY